MFSNYELNQRPTGEDQKSQYRSHLGDSRVIQAKRMNYLAQ